MDELEVKPDMRAIDARASELRANEWAQQVLDTELTEPVTDEQLGKLVLGAAILINTIAKLAGLPDDDVDGLVQAYRSRLVVRDRESRFDA